MCGGFEFQILCVSESATLALKDFIGAPCELQIVTDRGGLRRLCGIVTAAASGQSDGGMGTYKLTMRDALAVMEGNINTRVFRDRDELDIIQLLLKQWQQKNSVLAATFDFPSTMVCATVNFQSAPLRCKPMNRTPLLLGA